MNIENTITHVLTQISISYRTNLEKAMNKIGLHSGQVFVLIELWKKDGLSQIDLVKNLTLAAPTINKMVRNLMSEDFVECRKCSADGRIIQVFLTQKGRDIQSAVAAQWETIEAESYSNLTDTEKLVLFQLLQKLKENTSAK